jgi:hypothetical protein
VAEDIDPMDDWFNDEAPDFVSHNGEVKVEPATGAINEGVSRFQPKTEPM